MVFLLEAMLHKVLLTLNTQQHIIAALSCSNMVQGNTIDVYFGMLHRLINAIITYDHAIHF